MTLTRRLAGLLALVAPLLLAAVLAVGGPAHAATAPTGYWKTIDDDTHQPKSVVYIWVGEDGKLYGKIVKLFRQPDEEPDPVCDDCEGPLHNQRILGMQIINGLSPDGDAWSGGTILDPGNGETYKCIITPKPDGKTLDVRGYIGFSLIGRTQVWHRTDKPTDEVEYLK